MPRKKKYVEDEVIDKAMHAFWSRGYAATSVRTLEKEMGINQFSIYSSFKSKRGVFIEALKKYKIEVKDVFLKDLINSKGHIEDIRDFFNAFVDSVISGKTPNGCFMANTAMELAKNDQEISNQVKLFFSFLKDVFIGVLELSKDNGEISESSDVIKYANYLVGCTEGLAVTAKVLNKNELNDFIDMSLKSLK